MPTSKEHWWYISSSGQLVSGLTITVRAVNGITDLFTFTEPDNVNYPGLYTLVADTGLYDVYVGGVKRTDISPWLHIDSDVLPQAVASSTDLFGDASDGTYTLDGSQGTVSGLFTKDSGTQYTLLRDAFFNNLTLNNGITLKTGGYRLFVKGTFANNGIVSNTGSAGANGGNAVTTTAGTGGAAQASAPGGYLAGNVANSDLTGVGGVGGNTATQGGGGGVGTLLTSAVGQVGKNGVAGGNNADDGTTGGAGGVATVTLLPATSGGIRNIFNAMMNRAFSASALVALRLHGMNAGSGGGGGGRAGTSTIGDSMTGNPYPGKTGGGTASYGITGIFGGGNDNAMTFSGSNGNAQRPVVLTSVGNWSLEAWVKPAVLNANEICIYNGAGGSSGYGFGINTSGVLQWLFGGVTFGTATFTFPNTTTYHHVVMTRDGTTMKLYVDGNATPVATSSAVPVAPTGNFYAGSMDTNNYNGTLDEVAVYGFALSTTQIAAHFNAQAVSDANYKATIIADAPLYYWRLGDSGSGTAGAGGGGASPGTNGGNMVVSVQTLTGNGNFTVAGGVGANGGTGGVPTSSAGGGGGGGGSNGGNGGWITHIYRDKSAFSGTFTITGGVGGTGGAGGGKGTVLSPGRDGVAGASGLTGLLTEFKV